jgi:hypothetical protein
MTGGIPQLPDGDSLEHFLLRCDKNAHNLTGYGRSLRSPGTPRDPAWFAHGIHAAFQVLDLTQL